MDKTSFMTLLILPKSSCGPRTGSNEMQHLRTLPHKLFLDHRVRRTLHQHSLCNFSNDDIMKYILTFVCRLCGFLTTVTNKKSFLFENILNNLRVKKCEVLWQIR